MKGLLIILFFISSNCFGQCDDTLRLDVILEQKYIPFEINLFCDSITTKHLDNSLTFKNISDLTHFIQEDKSNKKPFELEIEYGNSNFPKDEYLFAVSQLRKLNLPMTIVVASTSGCNKHKQKK